DPQLPLTSRARVAIVVHIVRMLEKMEDIPIDYYRSDQLWRPVWPILKGLDALCEMAEIRPSLGPELVNDWARDFWQFLMNLNLGPNGPPDYRLRVATYELWRLLQIYLYKNRRLAPWVLALFAQQFIPRMGSDGMVRQMVSLPLQESARSQTV